MAEARKKAKIDLSKLVGTGSSAPDAKAGPEKKQAPDFEKLMGELGQKQPAQDSGKTQEAIERQPEPQKQELLKPEPVKPEPQKLEPQKPSVEEIERKVKELEENLSTLRQSPRPSAGKGDETAIERVPSGIIGLDELIEGGFEKGSTVLITGGAGTGKTTFALQFLYFGAKKFKEPGILISFEESRQSLYKHNKEFGWNFEELEREGLFQILEFKPHQVNKLMQEGGGQIKDAIKAMNAKRLAIDSITAYSLLFHDEYQKRENILEFFELLKKWGPTSLIISEMPPKIAEVKEGAEGFLTDAIISLYYSKKEDKDVRVHSLEILKMRGTKHTNKVCALTFEKDGIVVYPEVEVF
ncbi:MAG: ATPase domain-containing protein [Candidatus Diapherotrites archaeon]